MAIKLVDIVTVMKSKWTYGDKFFGYTEEFNDNHNTQYPSILVTPPTSVFPEVGINNGWENYTFEIYFSDLYNRTQQKNETIDQSWTNLQDLATEWLDMFLNHYQANAPIEAFLEDESVTIERNKEVANDQLLQLKMTFSWRVLSKCFRPVSTYPNQIANMSTWLRADSGVVYSTPTKRVSSIADGSGNGNDVSMSVSNNQPQRITYNGASDKTRIRFDGVTDELKSVNNSPINKDFTVFTVAKAEPVTPPFVNKYSTRFSGGTEFVTCGNPAGGSGGQLFSFNDGAGTDKPFSLNVWANNDPTQPWRGWIEKLEVNEFEYSFSPAYSQGYLFFTLYDNATGGSIGCRVTSPQQQKGEWDLYTATYDGSGVKENLKVYINGVESQDTFYFSGTYNSMQQTASNLDLGQGATNPYVGDLDECSVYDKQLSASEIIDIYNSRNPNDLTALTSSSTSLIGWWRMGDGAVFPTIPDDSTNSNDATMTNMSASSIIDFSPNSEQSSYFSYEFGNVEVCLGSSSERIYCHVNDGAGAAGEWNARRISSGDSSKYHISTMKLESSTSTLSLQYNNAETMSGVMAGYNTSLTYNSAKFKIGSGTHLGYLDGNIQEVIIYNRALSVIEISKIQDYLNKKYRIY